MTKRIVSYVVLASMLIGMLAGFGTPAFATPLSTSAVNLKVNALEAPLGIDTPTPEFSWNMESNLIGQAQASYHLVVAKDSAFTQVVWDSGLVTSDKSLDILYGSSGSAQALVAETDYYWKVTLTDAFGQQVPSLTARFSTGLMSTDTTINNTSRPAWNDAEFIGSSINTLDALTTAMYTVALQFQFMEGQRVFSFIFGADDPRLANSSLNVYGAPGGESFIRVEIDARTLPATFSIYRVGYDATDDMYGDPNVIPYKTGALGANVITADNISNVHTLSIGVNQSNVTISVNGTAAPTAYSSQIATSVSQLSDGRRPGQNNNNNVTPNMRVAQNGSYSFSTGNNYNGFPNLCSIGFQVNNPGDVVRVGSLTVTDQLQGSTRLFDTASGHGNVFSVLDGVDVVANDNITITGSATNAGVPLYTDPSHDSINYLRTEFQAEKAIAGAKLYATAMGGYEMFINGGRVGKDWFAPGLTQYRSVMNYNTYDVTELVKVGANAIAAIVGDGFWSGLMTFTPGNGNFWGARQGIMAKLVITYTDGTSKAVVTNKTDWKVYKDGPVRVGSMFQGQRYDANKEVNIAGWDQAGFDMSGWQTPVNITPRATTINPTISAQLDQPVRVAKIETATRAIESRNNPPRGGTAPYVVDPSTYVYDMGTTMTGVPSVTIPAGWLHEGDQVVFRFGEFIYPGNEFAVDFNGDQIQGHPDGYDYDELYGPDGGYHKNAAGKPLYDTYRFALATDVYVASKADETRDVVIEPHFTYRSFRFIQILVPGSTTPLPLNNVKGLSLSSIADPAGAYNATTADGVTGRMANQFFRNTQESQLGNFVSVPTDCPQRNERMGWTGDIQAYSRTATYHALDAQAFLRQWMVSCDADQATNGGLGDTVPVYNVNRPTGNDSSIVWGGAVVMAPWQLYQQYGDLAVVRKHYNNFRGYLNSKDIHPSSTGDTAPYAGLSTQTNGRADHIALDASTVGGEGQRLLCNVLLIYLLDAGAEMADAIGETAQAAAWREWRERAIISWNNAYVDPDTGLTRHMNITNGTLTNHGTPSNSVMDSQSSYAYALDFGIFSDTMTIQAGPNQGMAYKAFAEKRLAELIADPSKSKNGAGTQRNGSYVCYDNPYTVTS
ncbi:MAG: family 78 glycoside hydrolase catalytic domain, partial [Oscillospiraceae bacterium]|nr:family 78 glycoside hydrolase catalytic domain [Oscillospiraceae bacterium]